MYRQRSGTLLLCAVRHISSWMRITGLAHRPWLPRGFRSKEAWHQDQPHFRELREALIKASNFASIVLAGWRFLFKKIAFSLGFQRQSQLAPASHAPIH